MRVTSISLSLDHHARREHPAKASMIDADTVSSSRQAHNDRLRYRRVSWIRCIDREIIVFPAQHERRAQRTVARKPSSLTEGHKPVQVRMSEHEVTRFNAAQYIDSRIWKAAMQT